MIFRHFDGIVAWARRAQTNGFIEAITACFKLPSARRAVRQLQNHANRAVPNAGKLTSRPSPTCLVSRITPLTFEIPNFL